MEEVSIPDLKSLGGFQSLFWSGQAQPTNLLFHGSLRVLDTLALLVRWPLPGVSSLPPFVSPSLLPLPDRSFEEDTSNLIGRCTNLVLTVLE